MFVSGIAQGLGQGMQMQAKGELDRENINQLKEAGNMRRQQFKQQQTQGNLQNEQLMMQVDELKNQMLQMDKKRVQEYSYDSITNWMNSSDDRYLQSAYVENPLLNKTMAKRLGLKQITDVQSDGNGNLVFKDSMSGKEQQIPVATFLPSIGYYQQQDKVTREKAEEKFSKLEKQWKLKKTMAETAKLEKEATTAGQPSLKDQLIIQEKMLKINGLTNENKIAEAVNEIDSLANEGKSEEVYKAVTSNSKLYKEILPDESTKKVVREGRTAAKLSQRIGDFSESLSAAIKEDKVGGITNALTHIFTKYGIGTEEAEKTAAEVEGLVSRGESITADQLKLITGAAFNEEEMRVRLDSLTSAMKGYTGKVAVQKLIDSMQEWKATATNYTANLSRVQQEFIKGSLKQSDNEFDKTVSIDTGKPKAETIEVQGKMIPINTPINYKGQMIVIDKDGNVSPYKGAK